MFQRQKTVLLQYIFDRYMEGRLKQLLYPKYPVVLSYPINPKPRYGEGKPPHPELAALLKEQDQDFLNTLKEISSFTDSLLRIPSEDTGGNEPFWDNSFFSALDAICLYGLLGIRKPETFVEVGSGNSTKFARCAVRDLDLRTRIISIDPKPRAEIDTLCDKVIRRPLETVDPALLVGLNSGDILFIDSSHRTFTNNDVTVFFLEILPRLRSGVVVHIHDVFLPFDYPRVWTNRHYSEQYLLASYLLAGCTWLRVLLPLAYIGEHESLGPAVNSLWPQPLFQRTFQQYRELTGRYIGTSFWLEIT